MQGGPILYDQTFPVPFADPIFQMAISSAESVLTGAGAVSILGPTLTNSTNTSSSTTQTVQTGSTSSVSLSVTLFIGPVTIDIGDYGVCPENNYPLATGCSIGGTPLAIPPGGVDFDTFVLTLEDIFTTTTTTNTDLLTQDYELVGVPAAVPAPEPPTWALLCGGLLGMTWLRRRTVLK